MIVIYDSKTGNVDRFVKKLNLECYKVVPQLKVNKPFVLITYTTGFGQAPNTTLEFLESNFVFLRGVASSGNQNWGKSYAKAADIVSKQYSVPVILKFELSGTEEDINKFILEVRNIV